MDGQKPDTQDFSQQFKPGETISPRSEKPAIPTPNETSVPPAPVTQPQQVPSQPVAQPSSAPPSPVPPVAAEEPTPPPSSAPVTTPTPVPQQTEPSVSQASDDGDSISWTASEFVEYSKSGGWHIGLVAISIVAAAIIWLITKDVITPIVVIIAGGALSLYGAKRPKQLQYSLNNDGLDVGQRHYNFGDFKAFSVVAEGAIETIVLTPTKRFAPLTTIYYDPDDGDAIADVISRHLPYKERQADPIDKLLNRIRF